MKLTKETPVLPVGNYGDESDIELGELSHPVYKQILENQKVLDSCQNDYEMLDLQEIKKNQEIVEKIEKRIKDIQYQLDNTNPDPSSSMTLQEWMRELVNVYGYDNSKELLTPKEKK